MIRVALGIVVVLGLVPPTGRADEPHRSPIALSLSRDGSRLLSANQTAGSVSLVDPVQGRLLAELATGEKPAGVAFAPDAKRAMVTHWYGGDVALLNVEGDRLEVIGRAAVGPEPRGVVFAPDGNTAYVAVGASNEVVRVGLEPLAVTGRLTVGREPRGLAVTADGGRLLVGNARDGSMSVIDCNAWTVTQSLPTQGVNLRQVILAPDGHSGFVANMRNRGFATTTGNIDLGWVVGQRVTRVWLDGKKSFETLTLDVQGLAASDAHGVALSPDGKTLAVSSGGTHEILLFRTDLDPLPWRDRGSRDLMPPELARDGARFRRVATGGRPTELVYAPDGSRIYAANYLDDSIQAIDPASGAVVMRVALGAPAELSAERRGEVLFHAAERSFNQWYSCNTCHSDGHTNGQNFDTMNDGWQDYSATPRFSKKKVPTLRRVDRTGPWTWHGWQESLEDATVESFTKSMQGKRPNAEEVADLVAFLKTLDFPPNPHHPEGAPLSEAAERGRAVFRSAKMACASCHSGPESSDGKIHRVGLEERRDVYKGYNPPSLVGVYDKDPYLHDGRAATLRDVLTGAHNPEEVTGLGEISEQEIEDLIAYLKTL